jgi:DNA invertase Pin-like site-specific DNA recombinase
MNKTTRIAAIYARVSTNDQNPEIQVKQLKTFAKSQNIKIYKIYIDQISGTKDSRPELNNMLIDIRNKKFNCILIWKLDRLGRSLKHLITLSEEFYNKKIDLIITTMQVDTGTSHGALLFKIMGAIAEFERELISERVKLGQKNAKNIGKRGKDKKKRRTSGYNQRWINERKRMGK